MELVKVADGDAQLDGIVFDVSSKSKVVVAVMEPGHGPAFRTVHADSLSERTEESPDDRALKLLIRRTWRPAGGAGRDTGVAGQSRAGHKRGSMHRTTGK